MLTLDQFINLYPSLNTKRSFKLGITKFLEEVYTGEPIPRDQADAISKAYLKEERNHSSDLLQFAASLQSYAPKSASAYISPVRTWFVENDIEIRQKDIRRLQRRMPRGGAITKEDELPREILRDILTHANTRYRALFLLMISTGCRINEAVNLRFQDIDLDSTPGQVYFRSSSTKTKEQRRAFLTQEAKTALKDWLLVRGRYMDSALNRNRGLQPLGSGVRPATDDRIFPFTAGLARRSWRNALSKAGILANDERTGRATRTPHALRKFFLSQFSGEYEKIGEELAGHEGYLTSAYRRIPFDDLRKGFLKIEPRLTIMIPRELMETPAELREAVERLTQEKNRMQARLDVVESKRSKLEDIFTMFTDEEMLETLKSIRARKTSKVE